MVMVAPQFRIREATIYHIEARLPGRSWVQITESVEWPAYKDKAKAARMTAELNKTATRKR